MCFDMREWSGDNIYNDERGKVGGYLGLGIVKSEVGGYVVVTNWHRGVMIGMN